MHSCDSKAEFSAAITNINHSNIMIYYSKIIRIINVENSCAA